MAGKFSQAFIDRVIDATDMVQLVSSQTRLTKKGARYFGICPFHSEKTPSFSVDPEKKLYYCFGCGAGGNVVGYVMETYKYSFPEAIEYLANLAHMPIEYEEGSTRDDGAYQRKKRLLELNQYAARYFYACLLKNQSALSYLKKRGLTKETIDTFGLGYAPAGGGLYAYLKSKNYSEEELLNSDLVRKNERGFYEYFRERIIFPIMDAGDRIVAFGGRITGKGTPKYLNSPETEVFFKHSTLFNLNRAKKELDNAPLIVVEGYMDVIALYQSGIRNVCATLGTALSAEHAKLVGKYTRDVVLCYDGDDAGRKAAVRGSDILFSEGIEPKVMLLKDNEDPDSYVRKYGKDGFEEAIRSAMYILDFKIREAARKYDLDDIVQKARFLKEACETVRAGKDEVKWDYYAKKLAIMTDTEPQVILNQIAKESTGDKILPNETAKQKTLPKGIDLAQKNLLAYMMRGEEEYRYFLQSGGSEASFPNPTWLDVYRALKTYYDTGASVDLKSAVLYNNEIAPAVAELNASSETIGKNEVKEYIGRLEIHLYEKELKLLKKEIRDQESQQNTEQAALLLKQYNFIKQKLLEMKSGGEMI